MAREREYTFNLRIKKGIKYFNDYKWSELKAGSKKNQGRLCQNFLVCP